jgi:hypothetical protein
MSNNIVKEALVSSPTISESKASRTDALLKAAIDTAQPARLRSSLREMCKSRPDARKVTAALLLATQQQYRRRIAESTILLNQDEGTEDREESDRGPDQGEYDTRGEEEGSGHSIFEDEVPGHSADGEEGEEDDKKDEDVETTLNRNKRV